MTQRPFLYSGIIGSLNEDLAPSAAHIGRFQRLLVSLQDVFEERKLIQYLKARYAVSFEDTDTRLKWVGWDRDNLLQVQSRLIMQTSVISCCPLSPMALSWLSVTASMSRTCTLACIGTWHSYGVSRTRTCSRLHKPSLLYFALLLSFRSNRRLIYKQTNEYPY